jgi:hypothetical protein
VRAQSAPEQLSEPVVKIALAENGNGHAARTRDDLIPLDDEDLNTLQEL